MMTREVAARVDFAVHVRYFSPRSMTQLAKFYWLKPSTSMVAGWSMNCVDFRFIHPQEDPASS